MASSYGVTPNDIRLAMGMKPDDTDIFSDAELETIIEHAEAEAEKLLDGVYTKKTTTEYRTSRDGSNLLMLEKKPIMRVVNITVGGSAVTPKFAKVFNNSGKIILSNDAEKTKWDSTEERNNIIKYNYGKLDETSTETTTIATSTAGTGRNITVADETGFNVNDYVKFESIEVELGTGYCYPEITKVTGTASNQITCDISYNHGTGTRIVKMETPQSVKRFIIVTGGIMAALHTIGATYTFQTSYSIEGYTTNKGVPYPHFEKVFNSLVDERNLLLSRLRNVTVV